MWHVMITLHTAAGVAAFVVGVAALQPYQLRRRRWLLPLLAWLVAALLVSMVGAIAAHWNDLAGSARVTFSALVVLGLYMLHRARRAPTGSAPDGRLAARSMDDVGFLLISLFDGFVIVTALDLGVPPWIVAPVAVLAVLVGHRAVERSKGRAGPPMPASRPAAEGLSRRGPG